MNKTVKIIIGVVVIAALVAGGLYFGGVAGDGRQGLLKKKDFTVNYDKSVKKKKLPKSTDGIYMPKKKLKDQIKNPLPSLNVVPVEVLPEVLATYFYSDNFDEAEKAQLREAFVPDYYANALHGKFSALEIIQLWKAEVSSDYANALQGKFNVPQIVWLWEAGFPLDYANALQGKFLAIQIMQLWEAGVSLDYVNALREKFNVNVAQVIQLWRAGVPLDYVDALWGKFEAAQIIQLWEARVPLEYLAKVPDDCDGLHSLTIKRAYESGVVAEDVQC